MRSIFRKILDECSNQATNCVLVVQLLLYPTVPPSSHAKRFHLEAPLLLQNLLECMGFSVPILIHIRDDASFLRQQNLRMVREYHLEEMRRHNCTVRKQAATGTRAIQSGL